MTVTARGTSFQASVSHKGKRYRKDFPTKAEAEVWEAQMRADLLSGRIAQGAPSKPLEHTLQELFEYVCRSRWRGLKSEEKQVQNGALVVRILGPHRLVSTLNKQDALTIKDTMIKRCRADATINRKLSALSTMVKEAVELEWLDRPFRVGLLKERGNRTRFFTLSEEADMLAWCSSFGYHDLRDYILVSIDTGFRQGEVMRILKKDVGKDNLWTYDTKNGKNREVPLTSRVKEVLHRRAQAARRAEEPLFVMGADVLRDQWKKMKTSLDMMDDDEYTPHVLRHTFVTRLLESGVDIRTAQELAGHERIETTQKYAHSSPERKRMAIERLNKSAVSHDTM